MGDSVEGPMFKTNNPFVVVKPGVKGERTQLSFSFNAWTGDTFGKVQWGIISLSMLFR